ncbi:MAG: hypothetical protein WAQ33_16875 [Gaiellaceae bacterium]
MAAVALLACLIPVTAGAALPDGRRYELVSPQDKNGGDIMAVTRRTRAARSGEAVGFASLVGFAEVFGMGFSTDYIATRGSSGWHTRGITPRQEPQSATLTLGPGDRFYQGEFADDFSKGVVRVTEYPGVPANVRTVHNLLVREDLLAPGPGRYQLVTDSATPIPPQGPRGVLSIYRPDYADASADFGHVVFQSYLNLVPEATGDLQKLYEWDHGTLRLVGVLPDDSVSLNAVAGRSVSGGLYVNHIISDDGSRIYFTVQDDPAVGPVSGSATGQLYLRLNATSTIHVNASEKTRDPDAPASAEFWTASGDGTLAFFTTAEQLVDQDTDASNDLYRFDATAPAGARLGLLSVDDEPDDGIGGSTQLALGASEDGQRVYFVAEGQLIDGAPIPANPVSELVYLWDAGQLKYVGKMQRAELRSMTGDELASKTTRVTPDAKHLVFLTREGDQAEPHNHGNCGGDPCSALYVYSATANGGSGQLSCASCPPDGGPATSFASIDFDSGIASAGRGSHQNRPLTDDGRRVFFSTSQALLAEDHNSTYDAYQYTVTTRELQLISSGHAGAGNAFFMDASASGNDVFFATREQLVGWDGDQAVDLYDARVGGGFPEPIVTRPCEGDACQGPADPPQPFMVPPSIGFDGAGNVKPSRGRGR